MTAPRFSLDDLVAVARIIAPRTAVGAWGRFQRRAFLDEDRITIYLPAQPGCYYRIVRDQTNATALLYRTSDGDLRLVRVGTMDECLSFFPDHVTVTA